MTKSDLEKEGFIWLMVPEEQNPSWWEKHGNRKSLAAAAGSWLITFPFTYRKQRKREREEVEHDYEISQPALSDSTFFNKAPLT